MWWLCVLLWWGDPVVDEAARTVSFPAVLYPSHFNQTDGLANHHLITWKEGKAAPHALIQAEVPDLKIGKALKRLGAEPGNNVSANAWLKRNDPDHKAPDVRVEGTLVDIVVRLPDGTVRALADFLEDHSKQGFSFRFGGHALLAPVWRSGCVVCAQSCPGARISNENYTMRDLAQQTSTFSVRAMPPDGTKVTVILSLRDVQTPDK